MAEASVKDSNSWHVIEETREAKPLTQSIKTVTVYGVKREDGLTIIRESIDIERTETFQCIGSFGEFKFKAKRWNYMKNTPTDRYIVMPHWPVFGDNKKDLSNSALCLSLAKDIESALLHLPVRSALFKDIPVKDVFFQIEDKDKMLVRAGEVQHG